MQQIAKFYKVSQLRFDQDLQAVMKQPLPQDSTLCYEAIQLPKRATKGSAGYDFFSPFDFALHPGQSIIIPTGIRVKIAEGWVLQTYPRSGLGFRYRLQLDNTVGIIDSDYYDSENEGHILASISNCSNQDKTLEVKAESSFMQGIFFEFGITEDDETLKLRNGGFGSTTKR